MENLWVGNDEEQKSIVSEDGGVGRVSHYLVSEGLKQNSTEGSKFEESDHDGAWA